MIISAMQFRESVVLETDEGAVAVTTPELEEMLNEWLAGGGVIAAYQEPAPAVPQEVSLFQARAALRIYGAQIGRAGLIDEVDALVAALPNGAQGMTALEASVIREAWANAQVVRRDSPALALIFPALGLTLPEQLDTLFVIAAEIKA